MINRRILIAAALLVSGTVVHAASEGASAGSEAAFSSAVDLTAADLRRDSLDIVAPQGVAARPGRPGDRWPGPGRPDDRYGRSCQGMDRGWEEHRGGHGGRGYGPREACQECTRHHGSCTYQCTVPAVQCRAEWVGDDGVRRQYEGRPRRDRYEAEDDAVNRCRDENWNNRTQGRCRPLDCRQQDEVVENGRCR